MSQDILVQQIPPVADNDNDDEDTDGSEQDDSDYDPDVEEVRPDPVCLSLQRLYRAADLQ